MPERLTESEEDDWYPFVKLITRLPGAMDSLLQREAGLTYVEFYVLEHLSRGPARMSAIAEVANLSPSRLSHVGARLERAGLIERRPEPGDRRGTVATITAAGSALLERAAALHWAQIRRVALDRLSADDRRAMGRIGAELLAALDD